MTVPGLPAKMIGSAPGPKPLRSDVGLQGKTGAKGSDAHPFSRLLQEKQGDLNQAEQEGKKAAGAGKAAREVMPEGNQKVTGSEKGPQEVTPEGEKMAAGFEKAPQEVLPEGETVAFAPTADLQGAKVAGTLLAAEPLQPIAMPASLSAFPAPVRGEGSEGAAGGEGKELPGGSPAGAAVRQRDWTAHPPSPMAEEGQGRPAGEPVAVKPAGESGPGSGSPPLEQGQNGAAAVGLAPEAGGGSGGRQTKAALTGAAPGPVAVAEGQVVAEEQTPSRETPAPSRPVTATAPTGGTAGGDPAGVAGAEISPETARPGSERFYGPIADLLRSETGGRLAPAMEGPMVDPRRPEAEPAAGVGKLSDQAGGKSDRPAIPSAGPSAPGVAMEKIGGKAMLAAGGSQGKLTSPAATGQEEEPRGGLRSLSGSGSQPDSAGETLAREGRPFETSIVRGQGYEQSPMDIQALRAGQRLAASAPVTASGRPDTTPAALRGKDIADPAAATARGGAAMGPREGHAAQGASPRDEGLFPQRPFAAAKADVPTEAPSPAFPAPGIEGDGATAVARTGAGDYDPAGGSLRAAGDPAPAAVKVAAPLPPFTGARAQAVLEQMIAARQQISPEGGRIRVTLSPAELGDVDLEIVVRRHTVEVVMIAERPEIQQLLQSRGDEIRSALLRQDMKVENFQVFLQDHGEGSRQQSAAWTAMDEHRRGRERESASGGPQREIPPVRELPDRRSHRGSVSIFA